MRKRSACDVACRLIDLITVSLLLVLIGGTLGYAAVGFLYSIGRL